MYCPIQAKASWHNHLLNWLLKLNSTVPYFLLWCFSFFPKLPEQQLNLFLIFCFKLWQYPLTFLLIHYIFSGWTNTSCKFVSNSQLCLYLMTNNLKLFSWVFHFQNVFLLFFMTHLEDILLIFKVLINLSISMLLQSLLL